MEALPKKTDLNEMVYTPAEVRRALKIGRSQVYQMIRRGQLPVKRIGRMLRISRTDLEAFILDP